MKIKAGGRAPCQWMLIVGDVCGFVMTGCVFAHSQMCSDCKWTDECTCRPFMKSENGRANTCVHARRCSLNERHVSRCLLANVQFSRGKCLRALSCRCSNMNNWWHLYAYEVEEVPQILAFAGLFASNYSRAFLFALTANIVTHFNLESESDGNVGSHRGAGVGFERWCWLFGAEDKLKSLEFGRTKHRSLRLHELTKAQSGLRNKEQ